MLQSITVAVAWTAVTLVGGDEHVNDTGRFGWRHHATFTGWDSNHDNYMELNITKTKLSKKN